MVAPFWVRIRALLDRDIEEKSRTASPARPPTRPRLAQPPDPLDQAWPLVLRPERTDRRRGPARTRADAERLPVATRRGDRRRAVGCRRSPSSSRWRFFETDIPSLALFVVVGFHTEVHE